MSEVIVEKIVDNLNVKQGGGATVATPTATPTATPKETMATPKETMATPKETIVLAIPQVDSKLVSKRILVINKLGIKEELPIPVNQTAVGIEVDDKTVIYVHDLAGFSVCKNTQLWPR